MERKQLAARLRDEIERYERLRRGTSDERLLDEIRYRHQRLTKPRVDEQSL
ncbi:MAG TPA: hypothetical protein VGU20_26535 [Stellaceae bacterium]|nr:hypothetical protein [Stellaceae bacterium]